MMMDRYSRQTLFTPIGSSGQNKLQTKHVLIVGVGALGTSTAEMLTRAGVGTLTLVDRDYVEASNLQRQHLFSEADVEGQWPKAAAAEKRLHEINSAVEINSIVGEADVTLLEQLAPQVDLILDGTDNFETRFLINDISQKFQVPWILGSCVGSFGMSFTIIPEKTPCLQCLVKNMPMKGQTCDTVGVISPTVQMVTAYQTAEALKILTENWQDVRETCVTFDLWQNQYLALKAGAIKNDACLSCGHERTYPFLTPDAQLKTAILCGRNTVQIRPSEANSISLHELVLQWKKAGYKVAGNPYLVSVWKDNMRMVLFHDGRALVHGTNDPLQAKKIYHSFIG